MRQRLAVASLLGTGPGLVKLLGANVSLEIIRELAKAEQDVSSLAALLFADISIVSRALSLLRKAGLVEKHDDGRRRVFRLTGNAVASVDGEILSLRARALDGSVIVLENMPV